MERITIHVAGGRVLLGASVNTDRITETQQRLVVLSSFQILKVTAVREVRYLYNGLYTSIS